MKGFVATPPTITRQMVRLLFADDDPKRGDRILFPGVGEGPFIQATREYCTKKEVPFPDGYACDTHQERLEQAEETHSDLPIDFELHDFLNPTDLGTFDYIIGNPPYVPINRIDEENKTQYQREYETATGRFDLYLLFFERALDLLADNGRLVFITPEKFEYTETARPLRALLSKVHLERLEHLDESLFSGYTTYPTISVIDTSSSGPTTIVSREGTERTADLPSDGSRWSEYVRDVQTDLEPTGVTLGDVTKRISPGMATGADSVFVFDRDDLPPQLKPWAVPTVSGKQLEQQTLEPPVTAPSVFVCPYCDDGRLIPESKLGEFGNWLNQVHRDRLEDRSCYKKGDRRWYAWHENPPMEDLLQRKVLFRDITDTPRFWLDESGDIVPRHTVYYLIPLEGVDIDELREYLNSPAVSRWLHANCQPARNGYLRLQSRVIEDLPVPEQFGQQKQTQIDSLSQDK